MPRKLRPEEQALWKQVADTAAPIKRVVTRAPLAPKKKPIAAGAAVKPMLNLTGFEIGALAPATRIPPAPRKTSTQMDAKTHKRMRGGKLAPEAKIDLHGLTLAQAKPALTRFVSDAYARNLRLVLVVTGKGKVRDTAGPIPERTGVIRQQVPIWLRQGAFAQTVLDITPAHQSHGGGGAYYVYLRRKR